MAAHRFPQLAWHRMACLLTGLLCTLLPAPAPAADVYSFAVVPQFERRKVFAI